MFRTTPKSGARVDNRLLWFGAILLGVAPFTSNPLLTLGAIASLLFMFKLLWRPAEPPVLFYAAGYQWLQATILVFAADLQGLVLDEVDYSLLSLQARPTQIDLEPATWLTLIGVIAVALGMRLGAGRPRGPQYLARLATITRSLSPQRVFAACLMSMAASTIFQFLMSVAPGLAQPLLALVNVHWVFVFMLAFVVLMRQQGYGWLAIVFIIELGIGFLGFFSEFKTVLVVVLLAALAIPHALKGARLWIAVSIVALMVFLGVTWSAIKVDYRTFLNQGTNEQVALVSRGERIDELARLLSDLDAERWKSGVDHLVKRLTYVYFFSESLQMVPHFIPHEDGALWGDGVYRTLVPRLLDPDKTSVDDSERTSAYTGLTIIGGDKGTSVSLGYMAESYIDFGPIFMMIPLFLWGALLGYVYRTFTSSRVHPLFAYGCAPLIVITGAGVLEQSNAKMLAALVMTWVVIYLVQKYAATALMRALVGFTGGSTPVARKQSSPEQP